MMTPEGKLKKECRAWLRSRGAYVFSPVQQGLGASTLDDLVCYKGRFYGIEYKADGGKMTERQKVIMQQIEMAGGRAILAHYLQDVEAALITDDLITDDL